jgi:hypothetical protein
MIRLLRFIGIKNQELTNFFMQKELAEPSNSLVWLIFCSFPGKYSRNHQLSVPPGNSDSFMQQHFTAVSTFIINKQ